MISDKKADNRTECSAVCEDHLAGTCSAVPALCVGSRGTVRNNITLPGSAGLQPESLNGKAEGQDGDESRIELLQWYLKMALESEEDPKGRK